MKTNSRQGPPGSRSVKSSSQLDGLRLGVWNWDLESSKVSYSHEWKQLRGLDEIEIRNTPDESLSRVHPEDLEGLKRCRTKLIDASSDYYEFDHRVRHENGNWIWISERARADRDETGKAVRLIGCDIEITGRKQEELNLREQNEKQKLLSSIVEAATDFIGIANAQRKILYHNRSARNKNPKLNAEIRPDFLNSHPEWVQKILLDEAIPAVIKNGSWEGEVSVLGSEGQEIPVSQVLLGHKGDDGELSFYSTIIRDISERKKIEQALQKSERTFASLAAAAPVGFFRTIDGNNCVYVNQRWADLTGRPIEEVLGQEWMKCWHPDDLPVVQQRLQSFLADDSRMVDQPKEARLVLPDGKLRQVVVHVAKELDESGNVAGLVGTLTDVTERREVELALNKSQDKFQRIVEGVAEVIWSVDCKGALTYLSPRFESMFGLNPADWIGKIPFDLMHPDDRCDLEPSVKEQLKEGSTRKNEEFRHLCADGSYVWVAITAAPVMDEKGCITGFHGVMRDISQRKTAEIALGESDQRYASLAATTQACIFRMNDENECVYVNDRWGELTGRPIEEALGQGWMSSVHPDDFELIQEEKRAFLADDTRDVDDPKEVRHVRPDGSSNRVLLHLAKERDEHGKVTGLVGTLTDVEKIRATELALLESEAKIQHIAENVAGVVVRYVVHPDGTDEFAYVSSGAREVFGFDPEEIAGKGVSKFWKRIHEADRDRVRKELEASIKKLEPTVVEYRLDVPGKGTRWIQSSQQPARAENGDIIWDGVVLDHTESRATRIALQESREQFHRMTENAPGMIWRMTPTEDGYGITYLSSKSREMFEVDPEEALQDNEALRKHIHPDDLGPYLAGQKSAIENEESFNLEFRILLPKQGMRWRQCFARPSTTASGEVVWNGMTIDITERKEIELENDSLAKATKTKDEFLANMSHELRTPLTAILAMTDGLRLGLFGETTAKQKEALAVVEQSGMHLLDLINEILDIAKIESGQTKLEFSSVNVDDLCKTSLQLVTQQAQKKDIQTILNVPPNLPNIDADEKRLRQVLLNLLSNAIKFTDAGGEITLAVRKLDICANNITNEILRITVSDTGIGIHADKLESLFDPFVQVDSSLSRRYEGTGLGLSLVKQFVLLHSGTVSVKSEPGVGSCFTIDIPFRELSDQDTAASDDLKTSPEKFNSTAQGNSKLRNTDNKSNGVILLAEDNDNVADAMTPILAMAGFHVLRAENGKVAVEIASQKHPDLVLMDVQMPLMDGLEAMRKIRQMPDLAETPIIALSGFAMPEDSSKCKDAGADLFVSKPCKMNELIEKIHSLLKQKPKCKKA